MFLLLNLQAAMGTLCSRSENYGPNPPAAQNMLEPMEFWYDGEKSYHFDLRTLLPQYLTRHWIFHTGVSD